MGYQDQYQAKINEFNQAVAQCLVVRGYSNVQIIEIARALWNSDQTIPYIQPNEDEVIEVVRRIVDKTNADTNELLTASTMAGAFAVIDDAIARIKEQTVPTLDWSKSSSVSTLSWQEQVADLTADILCHARIVIGDYARTELPSLWSYAGLLEDIPSARCIDLDIITALWRSIDLPLPMEDGVVNDILLQLHHVKAHVYTQGLTEENRYVTLAIFQTTRDTLKNIHPNPVVEPKLLVRDLFRAGTRVLLVYPTLGKSYAAARGVRPFVDLDKSYLHYGITTEVYLSMIVRTLEGSPDVTVLACLDLDLIHALIREGIPFAIYRPHPDDASRECIIGRMKDRQTPREYIELVMQEWQSFADKLTLVEQSQRLQVQLVSAGQYLSDFIGQ